MEYEAPRRYVPHPLHYSSYMPRHASENHRQCYPIGRPVGGLHARTGWRQEDFPNEGGLARRRTAVAVSHPTLRHS